MHKTWNVKTSKYSMTIVNVKCHYLHNNMHYHATRSWLLYYQYQIPCKSNLAQIFRYKFINHMSFASQQWILTFSWCFLEWSAPESWCPLLSFFFSLSLSLLRSLSLWRFLCFLCSLSFSLSLSLCFLCFLSLSLDSPFDFPAMVGVPFSA